MRSVAIVWLALVSCDDCARIGATPRADTDAEWLALFAGDAVTADEGSYLRVSAELPQLRAMEPSIANIHVRPFDVENEYFVGFDAPTLARVQQGNYADWNCLNERYGMQVTPSSSSYYSLRPSGRFRFDIVLAEYGSLPGVTHVNHNPLVVDSSAICLTIEGDLYHYVFDVASGDCPAGCINHQEYYFVTSSQLAPQPAPQLVGVWDSTTTPTPPGWVTRYGRLFTPCPRQGY